MTTFTVGNSILEVAVHESEDHDNSDDGPDFEPNHLRKYYGKYEWHHAVVSSVLLNKTTKDTSGNGTDGVVTDTNVLHDEAICVHKDADVHVLWVSQ